MGFFGRSSSKKAEENPGAKPSTATWQSVASDNAPEEDDGSGFLHPESSLQSNRDLETSQWSKERSSQQLELEDVHGRKRKNGCCAKIMEVLIKALHAIDISCGVALLVYGSLIYTQFSDPAKAAVVFCLVFGTILFSTSSLGAFGLCLGGCSRNGLIVSGFIGPYVALVYLTMAIGLLVDSSGFLQYLDDNKEVMYLGPDVAEICERLMPLFYTILIGLGILEASRFCVLVKLRERLLEHDFADLAEPLIPKAGRDAKNQSPSFTNALTEALLEDNNESETVETGGGGGAVGKETTGTPNWWDK